MNYTGVAVGGPREGDRAVCKKPYWQIPISKMITSWDADGLDHITWPETELFVYRFLPLSQDLSNIGIWHPETMSFGEVVQRLLERFAEMHDEAAALQDRLKGLENELR